MNQFVVALFLFLSVIGKAEALEILGKSDLTKELKQIVIKNPSFQLLPQVYHISYSEDSGSIRRECPFIGNTISSARPPPKKKF